MKRLPGFSGSTRACLCRYMMEERRNDSDSDLSSQPEAAARAGCDLFGRAASNQRDLPHSSQLEELAKNIGTDLDTLHTIMRRLRIQPDPVQGIILKIAERVGRLKPTAT